jgi:hypothetical protein
VAYRNLPGDLKDAWVEGAGSWHEFSIQHGLKKIIMNKVWRIGDFCPPDVLGHLSGKSGKNCRKKSTIP